MAKFIVWVELIKQLLKALADPRETAEGRERKEEKWGTGECECNCKHVREYEKI